MEIDKETKENIVTTIYLTGIAILNIVGWIIPGSKWIITGNAYDDAVNAYNFLSKTIFPNIGWEGWSILIGFGLVAASVILAFNWGVVMWDNSDNQKKET